MENKTYTIEEAIAELQNQAKPYVGVMSQGTFASTLKRIKEGSAKTSTIQSFFERFGYRINSITLSKSQPCN